MADSALLELLRLLKAAGYRFTTPAPSTHRRVLLRRGGQAARDLTDVLGWNMRFADGLLDTDILAALHGAKALIRHGAQWVSRYRVASLDDDLYVHSGFPTAQHSVFFGPDSYRFAHFIQRAAPELKARARILDIGAGSGVGGVVAARLAKQPRLILADINAKALALAAVNAQAAGHAAILIPCEGLPPGEDLFDLIVANPPYIGGAPGKTYADGGGELGLDLSIAWARDAVQRLAPGGRFLLYSGSAITRGLDPLRTALAPIAQAAGCSFRYDELDPDVFPGTLIQPAYWGVERIAAVGAVFEKAAA
jgi:methylase of polypeptide subunit release factors